MNGDIGTKEKELYSNSTSKLGILESRVLATHSEERGLIMEVVKKLTAPSCPLVLTEVVENTVVDTLKVG